MIYWDLDGVIRELSTHALGCPASHWHHKVDGKDVVACVNEDLRILVEAPPTEYYPIIKALPAITIITCQPMHWRANTMQWVNAHLDNVQDIIYVDDIKDKLAYLYEGDVLVEDYPFFPHYGQIWLIDQPYNRQVNAEVRICNPEQMAALLRTTAGSCGIL